MLTKICLTFLLIASIKHTLMCSLGAYPPSNPCPAVFTYSGSSTGGWDGIVNIPARGYFTEVRLRVKLRVAYYRPEAGIGHIEVQGGDNEIQEISRRAASGKAQWLPFRVVFPPIDEVPSVVGLTVNERELCPTQQTPLYRPAGSIELTYTLTTGLTMGRQDSNVFEFLPVSDSGYKPITMIQNVENGQNVQFEETTTVKSFQPGQEGQQYVQQFSVPGKPATSNLIRPPVIPATSSTARPYVNEEYGEEDEEDEEGGEMNDDEDIASEYLVNMNECGSPSSRIVNSLIVNGQATVKGQWPWHVAIFKIAHNGDLEFQCSGNLISRRHVITAAHCVTEKSKIKPRESDTITLYLGKHNLRRWTEKGQQARDVDHIIIHPQFNTSTFLFDLAIVVLTEAAVYSDYVTPICLWDRSPDLASVGNQPGTVVGWGHDEEGGIGKELKMAKMPIVSQEICLRSDVFYPLFTSDATFCAGYRNGTSACVGDSGGGMNIFLNNPQRRTKTWYLRGVVSVSKIKSSDESTCDDRSYVIFTDLAKLLPWIHEQLVPAAS